jgi:hypothetical protein
MELFSERILKTKKLINHCISKQINKHSHKNVNFDNVYKAEFLLESTDFNFTVLREKSTTKTVKTASLYLICSQRYFRLKTGTFSDFVINFNPIAPG